MIKLTDLLNENKRFGNWSVTQTDEHKIKLVNQETMDTLYVHKEAGGKYSTSWKRSGISDTSLKNVMNKVQKLGEGKTDYEVYHTSYSSAVQTAEKIAQKKGFEVDEDDWAFRVATGPKKPSEGKTNRFVISLTKNGKPNNSTLSFQVFGMGNGKYELNAYVNVSNKTVK